MNIMMNRIKWVVGASALTLASGAGAAGTGVQAEPDWTLPIHDNQVFGQVLFDRMEYQRDGDNELALWDAQAWIGKDRNRLWVETEGETDLSSDSGDIENFDVQYSYRFDRFWDIQTGLGAQTTFGPSLIRSAIRPLLDCRDLPPTGLR